MVSSHNLVTVNFGLFAAFGVQIHHADKFSSSCFIMATKIWDHKDLKTETPITAVDELRRAVVGELRSADMLRSWNFNL